MALRFCMICCCQIDQERCSVLPATRLCHEHARQIERFGGEFKIVAEQERTSKAGSLKLNYGGISTRKRRNLEALRRLEDEYNASS